MTACASCSLPGTPRGDRRASLPSSAARRRPTGLPDLRRARAGSRARRSSLVESLRAWGGSCAEAPVYAFAPAGRFSSPSRRTIERLESLDGRWSTSRWSDRFADNPTYNKVTVSAWAERELDHETLVFTDTDSIFLGEPVRAADGDWVAAMRPVDRRNRRLARQGQERALLAADVRGARRRRARPFVETAVGQMEIRAYWNSGLVAARRAAGLFGAWEHALIQLHDADLVFDEVAALHGPAEPGRPSPPTSTIAVRILSDLLQLPAAPPRGRWRPRRTSSTSTTSSTCITGCGFTCPTRWRRCTRRSTRRATAIAGSPSACRWSRSSRRTVAASSRGGVHADSSVAAA